MARREDLSPLVAVGGPIEGRGVPAGPLSRLVVVAVPRAHDRGIDRLRKAVLPAEDSGLGGGRAQEQECDPGSHQLHFSPFYGEMRVPTKNFTLGIIQLTP